MFAIFAEWLLRDDVRCVSREVEMLSRCHLLWAAASERILISIIDVLVGEIAHTVRALLSIFC